MTTEIKRNTKAMSIMVTPHFTERLEKCLESAKESPANLSTPLTKSEVLRQAALIGFEVIECLGEEYQGNAATAALLKKKFCPQPK